ncbi:hypothetical protein PHYSODRAFT_264034 [Phytophthora sojae]|uniref:Uncharacterized protein n=1 Tax=Phytophthora sojae (strain P6497) TaxID=1094619 RepID=G4YNP7_PHYSP|nr:hypothetical protein PHYSODRAFT_264034 [Phytophthora sojae]EGZ30552.1 hypothetical protein PHYSODRAFT_264034 [Phytophthora sojae]|eukprot:XP_009517827.1 hypothetical protein PHYSODRAFT_264034 [Phytophthora sojae]
MRTALASGLSEVRRRVSSPPPLRASKRIAKKPARTVSGAALAEARKGKRKQTKRGPAASAETTSLPPTSETPTSKRRRQHRRAAKKQRRPSPASARPRPTVLSRDGAPVSQQQQQQRHPAQPASAYRAETINPLQAPEPRTLDGAAPDAAARFTAGPPRVPGSSGQRDGFNLSAFMAAFEPGAPATSDAGEHTVSRVRVNSLRHDGADILVELRLLRAENARLKELLQCSAPVIPSDIGTRGTAPNAKGELPPEALQFLSYASFPEGPKKAKGEYNPPQAHLVAAARMFKLFTWNEDSAQWWHGYCEALRAIDFQSSEWTMALVNALTQREERRDDRHDHYRREESRPPRREQARGPAIPEDIRRLLPVNRRGQEPCLRNVAGLPCSGGTCDRCGNPGRAHDWREPLQDWVDRTYGRNRDHASRR